MSDLDQNNASQTVRLVGDDEAYFAGVDSRLNLAVVTENIATNNSAVPSRSALVSGSNGTLIIPVLTDDYGRLIVSSISGIGADFSFGSIATAATTQVGVFKTAYTEQTSNAQRSIVSSSASDASAGTGARTVKITYLTSTGAGPYTETLTMNGTTPVNTVATNICFIEQIDVLTIGSNASNVGKISLKAATAGGGATIGTIAVGDNQTFWEHHYVPTGKICNVTGISCSHNGTTVGSGAVFQLFGKTIGLANAATVQLSDFVRLYGQSSTFSRVYQSPIKVTGPVYLTVKVTPESSSSFTYRSAFDFFEQ